MKIKVNLKDKNYDVILGNDLLKDVHKYIEGEHKVLIVTDENIPLKYIDKIKHQFKQIYTYTCKSGEESKSLITYQNIILKLLDEEFSRNDYIIALGGGVITDLAGFCAATFKRGIKFINIPTSTLAMIDASSGGKVGINFHQVKNMIGAFYQPEAVIIDFEVLKSLPHRHFINGLFEALKVGLIGNKKIYDYFKENTYLDHVEEIIYESLVFKNKIVEQDEKEANIRKILNFGHTFGHAYESYFSFDRFLHGEAVGLGMLLVSKNKKYYQELKQILINMNLDLNVEVEEDEMIKIIQNDKKVDNGVIALVEVEEIASYQINYYKIDELRQFLKEGL